MPIVNPNEGSGGGGGFSLGTPNNIFGATSGNEDFSTITVASSRTVAEATRTSYASANPAWIANYTDRLVSTALFYQDGGNEVVQYQRRVGSSWVNVGTSVVAIRGEAGMGDLSGVTEGRAIFKRNGVASDGPIRLMPNGDAFISGTANIESGSLAYGPFIVTSESGGFLSIINALGDKFTFMDFRTPRDAPASKPRRFAPTEAERDFPIQTVNTEPLTSVISFPYTTTLNAITNAVKVDIGADVTNARLRISRTDQPAIVKYWPTEADWLDDTGADMLAGTDALLDFGDSSLPFFLGAELQIEIRFDSGHLLGNTLGVPKLTAVIQEAVLIESADMDDIVNPDHPVTLRRDMPSLGDSLALANSSLNDNSALWAVANDQNSNSNRADATIVALRAGMFDLNGVAIPTTPVAANTIQLRGGTTVRIFGQNEFRVVNSPVLESDISDNVVDNVDLSLSGNDLTVTLTRSGGQADLTDTVTLPNTDGGSTPDPQPRFTRFEFQSQPTSVAPNTVVSGFKTFLINVERPDLLTGHLTISQDGTVLSENTLVPTVRSAGLSINSVILTNAGDTTTFTVSATTTTGSTITDHITVRAYQPHEVAYWGIRPTNDFAAVVPSTLTSVDVTVNDNFDVTGAFANGSFIGILLPITHDAREITTFNLPSKDLFTRTPDVREINNVQYILYTLQNNGGVDGSAAYNVEV